MEASWGGFCGLGVELERLGGIWKPLVDVFGGLGGVLKVILAVFKASGGAQCFRSQTPPEKFPLT